MRRRINREPIVAQYKELSPKYERLGQQLQQVLHTFMDDAQIDILDINYRVKKLDSLLDKIDRKGYKEPFSEIEDFCGLRIICFYPSDLNRISEIIKREFIVTESIDKAELLESDRFGYRSLHFIVNLKDEWLIAPQYRGLKGFKAEIQVRTILMHAWANLSHKLAYKSKEQVPYQFQRMLYQLGALFEIADGQFDMLQKEKFAYQEQLTTKASEASVFDRSLPLNIDSVQAFLDFYFPSRVNKADETSDLLEEIISNGITMNELVNGYERAKGVLSDLEKVEMGQDMYWTQTGAARTILDLTNDLYWKIRKEELPDEIVSLTSEWRKKIQQRKLKG